MSADNVVNFTGISRLDADPDRVLMEPQGQLESVVVIGFDHDGEFYFASSKPDGGDVLWLLERARHKLMQITDDIESGKRPI